jgi:hypothetical protein
MTFRITTFSIMPFNITALSIITTVSGPNIIKMFTSIIYK